MQSTYTHSWLVQDRIVLSISPENANKEEVSALDAELITYLDQAKGEPVHLIFDTSAMEKPPPLNVMLASKFHTHPDLGWIIVIGASNPLVKTLVSLAGKVTGSRFRILGSQEDAINFLKAIDLSFSDEETHA